MRLLNVIDLTDNCGSNMNNPFAIAKISAQRNSNENSNENNNSDNSQSNLKPQNVSVKITKRKAEALGVAIQEPSMSRKQRNDKRKECEKKLQAAINNKEAIYWDFDIVKHQFFGKYFAKPIDLFDVSDFVVCRVKMPRDNNSNNKNNSSNDKTDEFDYCNTIITYNSSANNNLKYHFEHSKEPHIELVNHWQQQKNKNKTNTNKILKKNCADLKNVDINKWKGKFAHCLAEGVCTKFRPILMSEDEWLAEFARVSMEMALEIGSVLTREQIYDAILPKRTRVTEEIEILYLENSKVVKQRNIERLKDPFFPISTTADLATCKQTQTGYIGITQHCINACKIGTHTTNKEMRSCINCTTIETKKLAVIKIEAALKNVDYENNGIFGGDANFNEQARLNSRVGKEVVVSHDHKNVEQCIHNVLLAYGINLNNFTVSDTLQQFMTNITNRNKLLTNSLFKYYNDDQNSSFPIPIPTYNQVERLWPLPMGIDRGANILKAGTKSKSLVPVSCVGHGGSNSVKYGCNKLYEEKPECKEMVDNGNELIQYQKKSQMGSKLRHSMKKRADTRFCCIYDSTHSIDKNYNQLKKNIRKAKG